MTISDAITELRKLARLPEQRRRELVRLASFAHPDELDSLVDGARHENVAARLAVEAEFARLEAQRRHALQAAGNPQEAPRGSVAAYIEREHMPAPRPVVVSRTAPTKTPERQEGIDEVRRYPATDGILHPPRIRERKPLAEDDPRHGTANGYKNLWCRCAPCSAAAREDRRRQQVEGLKGRRKVAEHGTESLYTRGCRCDSCREAATVAKRAYRERKRAELKSVNRLAETYT
jgi:hypothetical protein